MNLLLNIVCFVILLIHNTHRNHYRKKRKKNVRRAQSAAEFNQSDLTAANKRNLFKYVLRSYFNFVFVRNILLLVI